MISDLQSHQSSRWYVNCGDGNSARTWSLTRTVLLICTCLIEKPYLSQEFGQRFRSLAWKKWEIGSLTVAHLYEFSWSGSEASRDVRTHSLDKKHP